MAEGISGSFVTKAIRRRAAVVRSVSGVGEEARARPCVAAQVHRRRIGSGG